MADDKRTVLVIEDNEMNRQMLAFILSDTYQLLLAENGKVGLDILRSHPGRISLILLDLQMPVMNGYEFLKAVRDEPTLTAGLPIMVATSIDSVSDEIQCLEAGASDFITKPYNAGVILHRCASMIRLSETSAFLRRVERDELTGLYSKEFFYENAARAISRGEDGAYDIICTGIEAFRLISDQYGEARGDELLRYLAQQLTAHFPEGSIIGRIDDDVFAALVPHRTDEEHKAGSEAMVELMRSGPVPHAVIYFGVYENVPKNVPVSVACDNAQLSITSIKDHYGKHLAVYDEALRKKVQRRQKILDTMEDAIHQRQFLVFLQPKTLLNTGKTGGAEALARWQHPELGFLSPGEFIPLFEHNGFITQLTMYMLEETCRVLHKWLTTGQPAVPVSMNISRADFDVPNLAEQVTAMVDKYEVPHEYVHLEVTESAYIFNAEVVTQGVQQLKAAGFDIELDDFGSGYSSLNTLTELLPNVLKLDMSIVRQMHKPNQRLVLCYILKMAQELNMRVVAEGVETTDQAGALRALGCDFAQGYLYSKPLPIADFEAYIGKER